MCESIRVNKITVNVNKKYDETIISLYKTNELLGSLSEDELCLPLFSTCGVSLKAYQAYCKDFVIELLNNDGIPGYYYEPKQETQGVKYTEYVFKSGVSEYIDSILADKYEYNVRKTERIEVVDRYKDGYIKNAIGEFDVKLTQYDINIVIISEIKSGQLCRPKVFMYNDCEYSFNVTNINRIIKMTQ